MALWWGQGIKVRESLTEAGVLGGAQVEKGAQTF